MAAPAGGAGQDGARDRLALAAHRTPDPERGLHAPRFRASTFMPMSLNHVLLLLRMLMLKLSLLAGNVHVHVGRPMLYTDSADRIFVSM